jgi:hypothetical protein
MRFYQYILLFIFICVCYRFYVIFFKKKKGPRPVKKKIKEGFGFGYESLDNCLEQGYPNDFCARAPLEACIYNCPRGTFMPKKFNVFKN